MIRRISFASALVLAMAAPAFAHVGENAHGAFTSGFTHPFTGLDHLLAMIAVGVWAAQAGGMMRLTLPAAFVSVMAIGFVAAVSGVPLPFVEPAILASVVGLGLILALAVKLPPAIGGAITGAFALFHGHAHGSELGDASALSFAGGFVMATLVLHAAGLVLGMSLSGRHRFAGNLIGGATALAGAWLAFG